ncbi:RHS repeat-associated core domain protein-containing protein [Pseudomonas sp. GM60]|nr:RHS repeat-associated core domain protein-containing protein [Pseudomonas sp. GM60]
MNQPKAGDQKKPKWSRTVLLATNGSHSIIAEVHSGKANPIAYSAYGEQSAEQEVATKLGFNGQLREANMGWYLLGNGYRAYNPRLMRFHSPDSWSPFGGGGLNAYMYCMGDPVNHSDPTGHFLDAIKLFVQENVSFGGSAAQLAARNVARRVNGIARQKARYALAAAGGSPTPENRPSTSSGVAAMLSFVGGAPGPRGNSSPAIQYSETRPRSHPGYATGAAGDAAVGAAVTGWVVTPSPNIPRPSSSYSATSGGGPRSSFDNPRVLYNGPLPTTPVLVHERLLGGAPRSAPPSAANTSGPPGGIHLPTSPQSSRSSSFDSSGPSDWTSSSSSNSSRSSSPARLVTLIRKDNGQQHSRWM